MERYQVILAYDGSHYKGFQRQANAYSVQKVVEVALLKLGWRGQSILAAGRTDTGVHATGQVIAFDLDWDHSSIALMKALNASLPPDVVAREVHRVPSSFHPRHDAIWRKYIYRIYCQKVCQPLLEPYAWRVWPETDLDRLNEAARLLVGTHDFGSFGSSPVVGGTTVRLVLHALWKEETPNIVFEITAQAFLYHMVRRLAFLQVRIAQGKLPLSALRQALEPVGNLITTDLSASTSSDRLVHGLAPAHGLVLTEVHYPPEALGVVEDDKAVRI